MTRSVAPQERINSAQIAFQRRPVYDEFHQLYQAKQAWAPKEKRLAELTETIREWYEDLPADQAAVAEGQHCVVQISAKSVEKKWKSMKAIFAKIGPKNFLAICSVTFKALAGLLGNDAASEFLVESLTGSRRIKSVPLADYPERVA